MDRFQREELICYLQQERDLAKFSKRKGLYDRLKGLVYKVAYGMDDYAIADQLPEECRREGLEIMGLVSSHYMGDLL